MGEHASSVWKGRRYASCHRNLPRVDTVDTANSVKYENVIISAIKRNTSDLELRKVKTKVGKQGVPSLYLFEITEQKLNSYLENLISFSVIYRFIGYVTK